MFLLDTNVVSETRRRRPNRAVANWMNQTADSDLYVSAVPIGELQAGVEITREQDPAKADEISSWIDQVAETFNVLAMDARTFRRWARMMHRHSNTLIENAMIAATADIHQLIVVTRNVRDFKPFGVETLNPFR